ncbi:MAG: hypothetical protein JSR44_13870 [Spirochaetes bacterium]|nr:hypothetical protein [Spirochaetota bacterium]
MLTSIQNAVKRLTQYWPRATWARVVICATVLSIPALAIMGARSPEFKLATEKPQARAIDEKVLSIVQATPEGKISLGDERKEILVVFSHPIVPLAALDDVTHGAFTLTPAVKGRFRWYGSRICAFVPDEDWRQGAEYRVTIRRDTTALTGQKLASAKSFLFKMEVPPLVIENISPSTYTKLKYTERFSLTFNFPVAADALRSHLQLTQNDSALDYTLNEAEEVDWRGIMKKRNGRTWRITPRDKFKRAAKIELRFAQGLQARGILTELASDEVRSFETYGDFTANFSEKAETWSTRYNIEFRFSNPVDAKTAARAIEFSPPAKPLWVSNGETTALSISGFNVQPGQAYKITLAPFNDVMGNRLVRGGNFSITLPDRDQFFERVESGSVIEATMKQNYPLYVSNIDMLAATVSHFGLNEILDFSAEANAYSLREFLRGRSGAAQSFATGIQKNAIGRSAFNLSPYLTEQRGWVFAEIARPGDKESAALAVQATDLGITARPALGGSHIWLHALTAGSPLAGVKITRYAAKSMDGSCETNSEGYCLLKGSSFGVSGAASTYLAEYGNDKAFVTSKEQRLSISPGGGDFSYRPGTKTLGGIIVFDRKLHTPGDIVYFKAFVTARTEDRLEALKSTKIKTEITNAEGKAIWSQSLKTSAEGGIAGSVEIPKDAPLGHYTISLAESDGFPQQMVQETFQIEEFRPVNFAVALSGLRDTSATDTLETTVEGKYLFGAPMQNARFEVAVSRAKFTPSFANFPDFNFGDQRYVYFGESDEIDTGFFTGTNGRLAANGKSTFKIPLSPMVTSETIDSPEKKTIRLAMPYTLNVDASVKDIDDKSVANRQSAQIMPGKFAVGIRTRERYVKAGDAMQFEIIALTADGKVRENIPVKIQMLHTTWKSVRTQGANESLQTKNNAVRQLVHAETISTSAEPTPFVFTPAKGGEYYILAQAQGELGFARTAFYAAGKSDGFFMRDDDTVSLVSDKTSYKPGETAKIVIQSPVKTGRLILSLERERIYWHKQLEITDYAITVPVEIKEEYLPNVYLTALIIKPREKLSKRTLYEDLGAPAFKVGSLNLAVDTASKRARFDLSYDRAQYGPGDFMKISIRTESDAEIALSVADRAVLDLVNYHYTDPVSLFFGAWPLAIELFENRHTIIHQYDFSGKGNSPGGGPGEAAEGSGSGGFSLDSESGTRKNFRYTAYWKSDLKADKNGNAEVSFQLPDNLSTFRIMALGAANGKFANYEKEFRVQKALVVQPVMPRFMRAGDTLKLGAIVINQTGQAGDFSVNLKADFLNRDGNATLSLRAGEAREVSFDANLDLKKYATQIAALRGQPKDIKVEKNSEHPIVFSGFVTARADAREALRQNGFKDADLTDRVKVEFPIIEAPSAETVAIAGFTDSQTQEAIVIPSTNAVLGNLGSLDVTLSSTALLGFDKAFRFYAANPYFCLEQRASAFLLAVTAGELLQSFAVKPLSTDNYDFNQIEKLFLGELSEFVNTDGGLLLWKKSARFSLPSDPYLSAYALSVLQVAEAKKYDTPRSIRKGILAYLEKYLRSGMNNNRHYTLETLALTNLVMAREGEHQKSLTKFLLTNEETLSVRARARLALAIAASEGLRSYRDNADTQRLLDFLKNRMEITTTSITIKEKANAEITQAFYSPTSSAALVLETLIALDKENPLIPQLVNHLLKGKASYDTHAIGLIAMSLDSYRNTYETTGAPFRFLAEAKIGEKNIFSRELDSHKLNVQKKSWSLLELRSLVTPGKQQPLIFTKGGDNGRLYYTARLSYAPVKAQGKARDEGIELNRNLFAVEITNGRQAARKIRGNRLKRGELYLQKLMVTTPKPYYNVVIVDPLAAQTEVMNAAFSTEKVGSTQIDENAAQSTEQTHEDENYYSGTEPTRFEYRHDKVIFFFDYLPPGFHEYRYIIRPTVRGQAVHPSGEAKLMYESEIFGRSAAQDIVVE